MKIQFLDSQHLAMRMATEISIFVTMYDLLLSLGLKETDKYKTYFTFNFIINHLQYF